MKILLAKNGADELKSYLHDLGLILHHTEHPFLSEIIILNLRWAINAVYSLVDDIPVRESHGKVSYKELERVWSKLKHSEDKFRVLINLLESHYYCFKPKYTNCYHIPELFPLDPPQIEWKSPQKTLLFVYKYEFLPTNILKEFHYNNYYSKEGSVKIWKNGIFYSKANYVDIKILKNSRKRKISIELRGVSGLRNNLSEITTIFDRINKSYHFLEIKKYISCVCKECTTGNNPYMFDLDFLIKASEKGKATSDCRNSCLDVNINELLTGTNNPTTGNNIEQYREEDLADLLYRNKKKREIINMFIIVSDDTRTIKRLMYFIGLPPGSVNLDSTAANVWFEILEECRKRGLIKGINRRSFERMPQ